MEQDKCVICLTDFTRDATERIRALKCNHEFHNECMEKWLNEKRTCPVCRRHIEHYKPEDQVHSLNSNTRDQGRTGRTYEYDDLDSFITENATSSINLTNEELALQNQTIEIFRQISREATSISELVNEQNRIYLQQPERIHINQISERPENDNGQQRIIDAVNERLALSCGVDLATGFFLNGRPPQRTFGILKLNKEREPADFVIRIFFVLFWILFIIASYGEYMGCYPWTTLFRAVAYGLEDLISN